MFVSDLASYFENEIDSSKLSSLIRDEVSDFEELIKKKGSSISINEQGESIFFEVLPKHVITLCDEYLKGNFTNHEIYYPTTFIELSNSFVCSSEAVFDALSQMSDPVVNGPINDEAVKMIKDEIRQKGR